MEMIASVACDNSETGGVSSILRRYLSRMAELGNVPRNEKKFKNFLNNSLRINRSNEQDELWNYLKGKMDENKPAAEAPSGQPEEKRESNTLSDANWSIRASVLAVLLNQEQ
ncbi:hypothetical protein NSK_001840 [Nannochloropsis salina CCMP1776]|uniref:Uncharacterized protein n=1 Tax=Nannochloropsis salina CCMP1776 TaxID=1027361 RepID=A0A4D9D5A7_9STRA|nr:hypothetical protein NSK_001840 [Nannochloropsis salina CCMP1776]|eukprot:TFJ86752.1 hypothetical protein NSK_001840 [Nannochloropsis salina CCMP1776]